MRRHIRTYTFLHHIYNDDATTDRFCLMSEVWHPALTATERKALAMLFALAGYIWLAFEGSLDGAWLMVAGVLATIPAAGVQASNSVSLTFIWQFDHNGAYHLIQMVGILLLVVGLRAALLAG